MRSCAAKPTKYGRPRKLEQPRVVQTIPGAAPNGLGGVVVAVLEKQKLPVLCTHTVFVAMAPLLQWLSDDSQRLWHSCFQANNLHSRTKLRNDAQKHVYLTQHGTSCDGNANHPLQKKITKECVLQCWGGNARARLRLNIGGRSFNNRVEYQLLRMVTTFWQHCAKHGLVIFFLQRVVRIYQL